MKIILITTNHEGLDVDYDVGNREFVRSLTPDVTTDRDREEFPIWIRTRLYLESNWYIQKQVDPTYLNTEVVR